MRQTTNILNLSKPYSITILIINETSINISKTYKASSSVLINQLVLAGEILKFDFESTINFDFTNNADIRVKLNDIPLDTFLSNDGLSIRGSYEAEKSQLYLGFYQN